MRSVFRFAGVDLSREKREKLVAVQDRLARFLDCVQVLCPQVAVNNLPNLGCCIWIVNVDGDIRFWREVFRNSYTRNVCATLALPWTTLQYGPCCYR